ncbi:deaminase [Plantactinospora sp. WMMB334]|uniref:deaminase n=1 Tax=Plantactinospora sp. WMMB334 TaxID=3404119 RepID=UPI003B922D09
MSWSNEQLTSLMRDAVAFTLRHVESGGLPFVGVVIDESGHVSEYGVNQVRETGDPTAHAEIVAMRATIRDRDRTDLAGMSLLATGEPCGICYRFAIRQRIKRIYVAVCSDAVATWGFDYRDSYRLLGIDRARMVDLVTPLPVTNGLEPFERYLRLNRPV